MAEAPMVNQLEAYNRIMKIAAEHEGVQVRLLGDGSGGIEVVCRDALQALEMAAAMGVIQA